MCRAQPSLISFRGEPRWRFLHAGDKRPALYSERPNTSQPDTWVLVSASDLSSRVLRSIGFLALALPTI